MLTNPEPDRNIEELNDDEIYAAIRYLELAPRSVSKQSDDSATTKEYDDNGVVICVCLYLALFVSILTSAVLNLKRCDTNFDSVPSSESRTHFNSLCS